MSLGYRLNTEHERLTLYSTFPEIMATPVFIFHVLSSPASRVLYIWAAIVPFFVYSEIFAAHCLFRSSAVLIAFSQV